MNENNASNLFIYLFFFKQRIFFSLIWQCWRGRRKKLATPAAFPETDPNVMKWIFQSHFPTVEIIQDQIQSNMYGNVGEKPTNKRQHNPKREEKQKPKWRRHEARRERRPRGKRQENGRHSNWTQSHFVRRNAKNGWRNGGWRVEGGREVEGRGQQWIDE